MPFFLKERGRLVSALQLSRCRDREGGLGGAPVFQAEGQSRKRAMSKKEWFNIFLPSDSRWTSTIVRCIFLALFFPTNIFRNLKCSYFLRMQFFERALRLDLCLAACVCVRRARARPRPPPRVARAAAAGAMNKKGVKLLVDSLTRSAKHCESPPGCGSRAALFPCPSSVALLASGQPLPGAAVGAGWGWGGGYGCHGPGRPCGCLVFYQLNLQPVFTCVWAGQLTKAKWNVWSASSTRWWPRPAASLLGPASTARCSGTRCTAPSAWRMTWCWTEVRAQRWAPCQGWGGGCPPAQRVSAQQRPLGPAGTAKEE